jgi:hypothetical protein
MASSEPLLAPRQARFDAMFALLESQGIPRATLTLAWDFNTASHQALHARLLHMRDDALATDPHGPPLHVTQVTQYVAVADGSGRPVDPYIALELYGTMTVPTYLEPHTSGDYTNVQLHLGPDGLPAPNGTRESEFWIRVPYTALASPSVPHALLQYGHGLLNHGYEVREQYLGKIASDHHYILYAANMYGLSGGEFDWAASAVQDINNFVAIAGPLHQGLTEAALLARAMRDQLATMPDIASRHIVVDNTRMFYSGNSLGGVMGGTYMAIAPDIHRGHLGVPGNNFSLLLQRSLDFAGFFLLLNLNYPGSAVQDVVIAALQLQWDGTDPVSYVRHITAQPFVAGDVRNVIVIPAKGDAQVAVLSDEILARTDVGIPLMAFYDNQRTPWLAPQQTYPRVGSGIVLYDFGNPWPTPGNHPPDAMYPDPHELPRRQDLHNTQITHFFETGEIEDVCNGHGCHFMCDAMQMNCVLVP